MDARLQEHVCDVVAETFGLNAAEIDADASARTLAAWTSLAQLRLLANLEQAFGVRFTMDEMTTMTSVQAIERVLASKGIEA